ncbi:MAG: dTDP-4-dehydrorhamnose reductase [Caulobacteraceae bacterium]|nr:dTDP-4-dehydrorhamnose reductase [Caulobacter sp.]
MSRLLVFGGSGQLARELVKLAGEQEREVRALGRADLDLADPTLDLDAAVAQAIAGFAPDAVVNASGYTAVDKAESDPEAALRLNRDAPAAMARSCAAANDTPLVHVSTDYVFDGRSGPYRESDPVNPQGVYGRSKAEGEAAVAAAGGRAVTLRTSWVYAAHGANFVRTMLRLAASRDELGVVGDQRGRPTWARELSEACLLAADALGRGELDGVPVLHVSGGGEASWAEFAEGVFAVSAARGGPSARVRAITTAEYPTPAARPADSRLDGALAAQRIGFHPRPWRESLELCMAEMELAPA